MENNRRNAFNAAFKVNGIDVAVTEGNGAAARQLRVNESMVRPWRRQREEMSKCKKDKAFRGKNAGDLNLKRFLKPG